MQHHVTSFPLKRYHLVFSNSLHHESVFPRRHAEVHGTAPHSRVKNQFLEIHLHSFWV